MAEAEFQKQLQDSAIAVIDVIKKARLEAARNIFDDFHELQLSPVAYEAAVDIYNATNDEIRREADQIRDELHDFIREVGSCRTPDEVWHVITKILNPWNLPVGSLYNPDRTIDWQKVAEKVKHSGFDKNQNIAKAKAAYQVYKIFWEIPAS